MKIDELQNQLLKAARLLPSDERVPYAFERRIMARLTAQPAPDAWALWSRLLWRAAAPCLAIMLAMSIWAVASNRSPGSSETLAAVFERTVSAPVISLDESW